MSDQLPVAPKKLSKPTPMSADELRKFVQDALANQIFCLQDIPADHQQAMFPLVFVVAALGGLDGIDTSDLGTIYEYHHKALPRGVNGYPMFLSCSLMNKADWDKARAAVSAARAQQTEAINKAIPKEP